MKEGQTLHATVEKEYCPAMQLQQEGKLQGLLIQNMAGHGQAGQHLLATHVHPRCTRRAAASQVRHCSTGPLGTPARGPSAAQQGDRRHRQQAGTHRVVGAVPRRRLQACRSCSGVSSSSNKLIKVCWGDEVTTEQSNGVPENLGQYMVLRNRAI
jgi:hypothetical protein